MNINHVLIRTQDLDEMVQFLTHAIGLEKGFRPSFPFPGIWLYSSDTPLIHLVEANHIDQAQADYLGANIPNGKGSIEHIALAGDNYDSLIDRLQQQQIAYTERTVPLTKEHQVFVQGPDGIALEILFAYDKRPLSASSQSS